MISSEVARCKSDIEDRFTEALEDCKTRAANDLKEAEGRADQRVGEVDDKLGEGIQALRKDLESECAAIEARVTLALETQRTAAEQQVREQIGSAIAQASSSSEKAFHTAMQESEDKMTGRVVELQKRHDDAEDKLIVFEKRLNASEKKLETCGGLEEKVSSLSNQVKTCAGDLEKKVDAVKRQEGALDGKVEEHTAKLKTHELSLDSTRYLVDRVSKDVKDNDKRLKDTRQAIDDQRTAFYRFRSEIDETLKARDSSIDDLQFDFKLLPARLCALVMALTDRGQALGPLIPRYMDMSGLDVLRVKGRLDDLALNDRDPDVRRRATLGSKALWKWYSSGNPKSK